MTTQLVAATVRRDIEALYVAHAPQIRRWLIRHTRGDFALADDLTQETFARAMKHLGRTSARGNFKASSWLHEIARNALFDVSKYQRRHLTKSFELQPVSWGEELPAPEGDDIDLRLDMAATLATLPSETRAFLTRRYVEDRPLTEVAAQWGIPMKTAKQRAMRRKNWLKRAWYARQEAA